MRSRIDKIALIPVTPPHEFRIEDRTLAAPFLPISGSEVLDRHGKGGCFHQNLESVRTLLGSRFTSALHDELTKADLTISKVDVPCGSSAGKIDYKTLPTRDAVLHVVFADVGMCSSHWSDEYEPRINVSACLMAHPHAPDWLFRDHFYYGADASGNTAWSIPADPKFKYDNFGAMVDRADEVGEACEVALDLLAQRIANQLRASL